MGAVSSQECDVEHLHELVGRCHCGRDMIMLAALFRSGLFQKNDDEIVPWREKAAGTAAAAAAVATVIVNISSKRVSCLSVLTFAVSALAIDQAGHDFCELPRGNEVYKAACTARALSWS